MPLSAAPASRPAGSLPSLQSSDTAGQGQGHHVGLILIDHRLAGAGPLDRFRTPRPPVLDEGRAVGLALQLCVVIVGNV